MTGRTKRSKGPGLLQFILIGAGFIPIGILDIGVVLVNLDVASRVATVGGMEGPL